MPEKLDAEAKRLRTISPGDLADAIGALEARVEALKAEAEALKAEAIRRDLRRAEGEAYRIVLTPPGTAQRTDKPLLLHHPAVGPWRCGRSSPPACRTRPCASDRRHCGHRQARPSHVPAPPRRDRRTAAPRPTRRVHPAGAPLRAMGARQRCAITRGGSASTRGAA